MKTILMVSTYGDFFWSFEKDNIKIVCDMGYKVYIAANFTDKQYTRYKKNIVALGVEIIDIPFVRSPFSSMTLKNFVRIKKVIDQIQPDIIDCHLAVAGTLSRLACLRNKKSKIIYSPHGFFFYKGCPLFNDIFYKHVECLMAKWTDALITINTEDYEAAKKMKVRGKVYFVPGVGVDLKKVKRDNFIKDELRIDRKEILFLSVGELNANKNHSIVIKAIKRLKDRGIDNIHYAICGEGSEKENLLRLSETCGVKQSVHLLGFRNDVGEIDKGADVFILPSFKEGLSVSVIEAMGASLPVIASRIRGNTDLILEGKGGFLFNPDDEVQLAELMYLLINDRKLRRDMGIYNENVSYRYSKHSVHEIMERIYKEVDGQ